MLEKETVKMPLLIQEVRQKLLPLATEKEVQLVVSGQENLPPVWGAIRIDCSKS